MKSQLPKNLELISHLLRMAADEFGNHGCNDFDLKAIMPDVEDRRALLYAMHKSNGDPEEFIQTHDYAYAMDWWLMSYFARNLGNIVAQVQKDALEEGFEIAACFGEINHDEIWTGSGKELDMESARKYLKKRLDEIKIK